MKARRHKPCPSQGQSAADLLRGVARRRRDLAWFGQDWIVEAFYVRGERRFFPTVGEGISW
eukprot:11557659-Prorocentrum_lima.AAC.1